VTAWRQLEAAIFTDPAAIFQFCGCKRAFRIPAGGNAADAGDADRAAQEAVTIGERPSESVVLSMVSVRVERQAVVPMPCPPTGEVSMRCSKPAINGLPFAMAAWTDGSDNEASWLARLSQASVIHIASASAGSSATGSPPFSRTLTRRPIEA